MKDNSAGVDEYNVIYNGKNYPIVTKFTVADGVVGGNTYTFKVQAINFNGLGPASNTVEYTICAIPGALEPP